MSELTSSQDPKAIRAMVEKRYGEIAEASSSCCAAGCGCSAAGAEATSQRLGYTVEALRMAPPEANLGLGCGHPTAIESLRPGEVVLDLGSGAGLDAFLAARAVGAEGRVIGVDMTEAMLARAREAAQKNGFENVEFRKGHIEELPVEEQSVDVIISNCVVNLSPEKARAFQEAFRVLRPGGRLMISDVVLERPLPEAVRGSLDAYLGCVAGASLRSEYLALIEAAGFEGVQVTAEASFSAAYLNLASEAEVDDWADRLGVTAEDFRELAGAVTSVHLLARRRA